MLGLIGQGISFIYILLGFARDDVIEYI
jgi:hypothetical protein